MNVLHLKLLRNLRQMRGMIAAIALVVACGIMTYVTMAGAYQSLIATQELYYEHYRYADVFASLKRAPETLARRIAEIPRVENVQTRLVFDVTLDVPGLEEPAVGRFISVPEQPARMLNDIFLRSGRYIDPLRRNEVMVNEAFAEANGLQVGDRIAAILNGRKETLTIAGIALSPEYIYALRGGTPLPDNRRFGILWMSRKAMEPAFDMKSAFNNVCLKISAGASEAEVISKLDALLQRYGGLGAGGRDEQISHRFLMDEIAQDRVTSIFIPTIFLAIAAFLLHVVLLRLVGTQRSQIAILKAFGYSNTSIGLHYLQLALAGVLLGSLPGILTGFWLAKKLLVLYAEFFRFPEFRFDFSLDIVVIALLSAGCAACFGAMSAVRRAVRLPPAEAMRQEPPASFHQGLLDRSGVQKFLSPITRMIARNMIRRPARTLLSATGIGFAVAIVLVGLFMYDSMDYMLRMEFEYRQRENVTLYFNNPISASVGYEISRLPGILQNQPFRTVPVRLRFEHRTKKLAVLGLREGISLHRTLNQNLQSVAIPSDGLLITDKLGELLGVHPGDQVTLEVLEGKRVVRNVVIQGTVDELIGLSAYMNLDALNRLMGEGSAYSGTFLKADESELAHLYSSLKLMPSVSGVEVKDAMIRSFNETLARSMGITVDLLLGFACVIALGMVYNGSRIALSERSNELASLRVLGFTQNEVAKILLGEQAILTAVGIPVGLFIGYAICWLMSKSLDLEIYRFPVVIESASYASAALIVCAAALLSSAAVLNKLKHMDLVAVLKERE